MRISFPLAGFNLSGGVRIIFQIANGLAKKGCEVKLLVPDYAAKSHFQLDDKVTVQIISTRGKGIWRKIHYFLKMCFMAVGDSDICFATGYKPAYYILCSKIVRSSGTHLVYLIQHYEPLSHVIHSNNYLLVKFIPYLIEKFSYKLPFTKIAVSQWIKDQIKDDTIFVINNGIDLRMFYPVLEKRENEQFVIGTIGNISRWKGYDVFLEVAKLIARDKEIKVLIASKDDIELPRFVSSECICPKSDEELIDFYHQCDIFIFTSMIEGFGLPPLEAMACGIPVITTDCGGVRAFADNLNAIIVCVGDARAIADAVTNLKKDKNLRERLRQRGLETAKRFSLEMMISQYYGFLQQNYQT